MQRLIVVSRLEINRSERQTGLVSARMLFKESLECFGCLGIIMEAHEKGGRSKPSLNVIWRERRNLPQPFQRFGLLPKFQ